MAQMKRVRHESIVEREVAQMVLVTEIPKKLNDEMLKSITIEGIQI